MNGAVVSVRLNQIRCRKVRRESWSDNVGTLKSKESRPTAKEERVESGRGE